MVNQMRTRFNKRKNFRHTYSTESEDTGELAPLILEENDTDNHVPNEFRELEEILLDSTEDKFVITENYRKDLITWCSIPWEDPPFKYSIFGVHFSDAWTYMVLLGGVEKVSVMVNEIQLDKDGDGNLSKDELLMQEEYCLRLIEQSLNFLVNAGVVGALLMSIIFPISLTALPYGEKSLTFFGNQALLGFVSTYYVFLYSSLFFSIWITFMTLHYYLHITLWMPTLEMKMCKFFIFKSLLNLLNFTLLYFTLL